MKGTQPIFSYAQEKNWTVPQIEQREGKMFRWRRAEKKRKVMEDKRETCKETTKEKHQKMMEEASVPTREQDGYNTIVSVDHEGMSAKLNDSIQDLCINQPPFL